MKARIELSYYEVDEIDLTDYGHDENVCYEDLSDDDQNEIRDSLREQIVVAISIETIYDQPPPCASV